MDLLLFIKVVIIGIVEGITEYLPVSSTGHMIIVGDFINFKEPFVSESYKNMFDVVIQLGAILAIVVLYWDKIKDSLINIKGYGMKLWTNIIIAFIPSAVVGLLVHDFIEENLFNPLTVTLALIVGGFLMIFIEKRYGKGNFTSDIDMIKPGQAFKIGLFQCLSLWPGMSRSASTIMGGWISGLNNVAAAEFSFFLALPTMIAASGLVTVKAILKGEVAFSNNEIIALVIGFVVSFLVALVVVDKFVGFLKKKPMKVFAVYRIIIGILLLGLAYSKVISFTA
jgi:undecaprenyl-diphosphatase